MNETLSILHLEESAIDAQLTQSLLARAGFLLNYHRVETRDAFEHALNEAKAVSENGGFDLILADYNLPTFDGGSALEIALAIAPYTPFIFVSGKLGEEAAIESMQRGATDYVLKQRLERLVPAVRRAMQLRDERDRRRAAEHKLFGSQQSLALSHERLDLVINAAQLGLWYSQPPFEAIACNATFTQHLGLPIATEISQQAFYAQLSPVDHARAKAAMEKSLRDRTIYSVDLRIPLDAGEFRWIRLIGRASFAQDKPTRFDGISIDITTDQRHREALRQSKLDAESANQAKDQFLAILSHELRTPLTPILAATQLLQMEDSLSAEMREHVRLIHRNAELEARLIDDLLDLTRITRNRMQLHLAWIDLHTVLANVVEICQSELRGKRQTMQTKLFAQRSTVHGDSARLSQVFWNLLKNACKFTPDGGSIAIATRNTPEGALCVEVADTGIGIDRAAMPKLFNAFELGDDSISRRMGGLGLGLAIAKALVEKHGGSIQAASPGPGKGSTFSVTLPVGQPPPADRRESAATSPMRRLRILLVEDHADTARAMTRLLSRMGHDVKTANCVKDALALLESHPFDLLVSDIGLPDGTGFEIAQKLPKTPAVPAIALTGFGMEHDIQRSRDAGFVQHLTKPVNFDKLETLIRTFAEEQKE